MERHVVLPHVVRAVSVEPERVLILSNAVVEPSDLEGYILKGSSERVEVRCELQKLRIAS